MRLRMRRLASTLLFGLACSVITALHISSQRLPSGGDDTATGDLLGAAAAGAGRRRERGPGVGSERGAVVVAVAGPGPGEAVAGLQEPLAGGPDGKDRHRGPARKSLGVRLQRGMAWAAEDDGPSSADTADRDERSPHHQLRRIGKIAAGKSPETPARPTNRTVVISVQAAPADPHRGLPPKGPAQVPLGAGDPRPMMRGSPAATRGVVPVRVDSGRASSAPTELEDIFIGVKTTGAYHRTRVQLIVDTWLPQAQSQTFFFTDRDDPHFQQILGDHLINTRCAPQHSRQDLCCKVAFIYDTFLKSGKRWFCHLDDDNYLNVANLVKLLRGYNHRANHYLGKPSLDHPIQAMDRDRDYKETSFWFATGGAGFCISQSLAFQMAPLASGGQFENLCSRVRLPDDVSIGFVIDVLLHVPLTRVDVFNSHLQGLNRFDESQLREQVTLSYYISAARNNTIILNHAAFSKEQDPTRMRSLHCMLFPDNAKCP